MAAEGGFREHFAAGTGRPFYAPAADPAAPTSWSRPDAHREACADATAAVHGVSEAEALAVELAVESMLAGAAGVAESQGGGEAFEGALAVAGKTLVTVLRNGAQRAAGVPKYGRVRKAQPRLAAALAAFGGGGAAEALLAAAGWAELGGEGSLVLLGAGEAGVQRRGLASAERLEDALRRRADDMRRAVAGAEAGSSGSGGGSKCDRCGGRMEDGRERLWSGRHDAPCGEYRYSCEDCRASGVPFTVCERCWDARGRGEWSHDEVRIRSGALRILMRILPSSETDAGFNSHTLSQRKLENAGAQLRAHRPERATAQRHAWR